MSAELTPTQRRWFLIVVLTGFAFVFGGWFAEEGLQQVGLRAPDEALGVTTRSGTVYVRTDWAIVIHALGTIGTMMILVPLWLARSKLNADAQVRSERETAKFLNKSAADVGIMWNFAVRSFSVMSAAQIYRLIIDLLNLFA